MAGKLSVTCKILDIKQIPNSTKQIVSLEFTLGSRVWKKGFRLDLDRAISMEEFQKQLVGMAADPNPDRNIWPKEESDYLAFVKEESDKPFTIQVNRPD